MASTTSSEAQIQRKFLAILNKITKTKLTTCLVHAQSLRINSTRQYLLMADLLHKKAVDEPLFSNVYAALAANLIIKDKTGMFRKRLIFLTKEMVDRSLTVTLESDMTLPISQRFTHESPDRRNQLGNAKFIGEMYNAQVLSAEVITHVCESYIRASTEHGLDSICRLLQTAGKLLEQQLQSQGQTEVITEIYRKLRLIQVSRRYTMRLRVLILNLLEYRQRGYLTREGSESAVHLANPSISTLSIG